MTLCLKDEESKLMRLINFGLASCTIDKRYTIKLK